MCHSPAPVSKGPFLPNLVNSASFNRVTQPPKTKATQLGRKIRNGREEKILAGRLCADNSTVVERNLLKCVIRFCVSVVVFGF